jgi:hypothetical protein
MGAQHVEYSLHPIYEEFIIEIENDGRSLTATRLLRKINEQIEINSFKKANNNLLSKDGILRNACTIAISNHSYLVASIIEISNKKFRISVTEQGIIPYTIFECKRVGVEEKKQNKGHMLLNQFHHYRKLGLKMVSYMESSIKTIL